MKLPNAGTRLPLCPSHTHTAGVKLGRGKELTFIFRSLLIKDGPKWVRTLPKGHSFHVLVLLYHATHVWDYDLSSLRDLMVHPFYTCWFGQEVLRHVGKIPPTARTMARVSGALPLPLLATHSLSLPNITTTMTPSPSTFTTTSPRFVTTRTRKLGQTTARSCG